MHWIMLRCMERGAFYIAFLIWVFWNKMQKNSAVLSGHKDMIFGASFNVVFQDDEEGRADKQALSTVNRKLGYQLYLQHLCKISGGLVWRQYGLRRGDFIIWQMPSSVQTLPVQMIHFIQHGDELYLCAVIPIVLCSATQPVLDKGEKSDSFDRAAIYHKWNRQLIP